MKCTNTEYIVCIKKNCMQLTPPTDRFTTYRELTPFARVCRHKTNERVRASYAVVNLINTCHKTKFRNSTDKKCIKIPHKISGSDHNSLLVLSINDVIIK